MIRHNGIIIDRKSRVITHNRHTEHFPWRAQAKRDYAPTYKFDTFCHLIMKDYSRAELFELVFGNSPDGGPDLGYSTFDIRFHQWAPDMARLSLRLERERVLSVQRLRLVPNVV